MSLNKIRTKFSYISSHPALLFYVLWWSTIKILNKVINIVGIKSNCINIFLGKSEFVDKVYNLCIYLKLSLSSYSKLRVRESAGKAINAQDKTRA